MNSVLSPRAAKAAERKASAERIAAAQAATQTVVEAGACPLCGRTPRRNRSIAGWWQCEQLGAVTHRAYPDQPACAWQGFTQ